MSVQHLAARQLFVLWVCLVVGYININCNIKIQECNYFSYFKYQLHVQFRKKKGKRKVQGVPQSQTAVLPRPEEEEETDKSKQAQIEQTYEKH